MPHKRGPKERVIHLDVRHLRQEIAWHEKNFPDPGSSLLGMLSEQYVTRLRAFADCLERSADALLTIPEEWPELVDELEELSSWLPGQRTRNKYCAFELLRKSGADPAEAEKLAELPARAGLKPSQRQRYIKAFELLQDRLNYQQVLNQLHDCHCEVGRHTPACRDCLRKGVAQVKGLLTKYGIEVIKTKSIRK